MPQKKTPFEVYGDVAEKIESGEIQTDDQPTDIILAQALGYWEANKLMLENTDPNEEMSEEQIQQSIEECQFFIDEIRTQILALFKSGIDPNQEWHEC